MARLVHITSDTDAARIRRHGIRPSRIRGLVATADRFVWAFPVLGSYTLTHQWGRELKRWGRHTLAVVTFAIEDEEPVFVGHFKSERLAMTAAEAIGVIRRADDPRGYEIMVPRRIAASEIRAVRVLPKAVGWRYWPDAKRDRRWPCDCPVCLPQGEVRARRYREGVPMMQHRWELRAKPLS